MIAARGDGAAVVAWVGRATDEAVNDEEAPVYAGLVPRSGRPRHPTRLSDRRTGATEAFVTATSANEAIIVWQPAAGGDTHYASLGADGTVTPSRTLSGGFVDSGFFGLRPLVTRDDGAALLLADGPGSPTIYAWRTRAGFRPAFVAPAGEDVYSANAGAGLAVNGRRLLAVWQQPEYRTGPTPAKSSSWSIPDPRSAASSHTQCFEPSAST